MKACCCCGIVKPLDEYGRWSKGKDGHRHRCKTCYQEREREVRRLEKQKRYIKKRYKAIMQELREDEAEYEQQHNEYDELSENRAIIERILRGDIQFIV